MGMKCERRFLLRQLPPGLAAGDEHLQLTDNYITGTRLRLRKIRVPRTRERAWSLQQRFAPVASDLSSVAIASLELTQYEYEVFAVFEGNEIRKNRYAYEHDGRHYMIDVYLGDLRGLIIARARFETGSEATNFVPPPFAILEVTNDEMFTDPTLVGLTSDDLRAALANRPHLNQ